MPVGRKPPPNAGKGRPKGIPNKITADLKAMILGALNANGGQEYLQRAAEEEKAAFLALLGKCLPKDINLGGGLRLQVNLVREDGRPAND